jgi:hypothetical protein
VTPDVYISLPIHGIPKKIASYIHCDTSLSASLTFEVSMVMKMWYSVWFVAMQPFTFLRTVICSIHNFAHCKVGFLLVTPGAFSRFISTPWTS